MSDYTTRKAFWAAQGCRRCVCGQKVYDSFEWGLQHVADWDDDRMKIPAHKPSLT